MKNLPLKEALDPMVEELEKRYLTQVLKRTGGHLGRAAQHAGIHRRVCTTSSSVTACRCRICATTRKRSALDNGAPCA